MAYKKYTTQRICDNSKALFLLLSVLAGCHRSPVIDFNRERIVIEIENMEVRVSGEYFFRNTTTASRQIKIYYPFPVDSIHEFPNTIVLDYAYGKDSSGLFFVMPLEAKESNSFKITYNQRLKKNVFRYIATATSAGQKPIQLAEFTIITPTELTLKLNYRISKRYRQNGRDHYYIKYDYFLPDEDLLIEWQYLGLPARGSL